MIATAGASLANFGQAFFTRFISVERGSSASWSEPERKTFRRCLASSALFYLLCAIFCDGFYGTDEYFQIIEFASSKLGLTSLSELPWEFQAQARSWIQPAMFVGLSKVAAAAGIHQPLTLIFLFRLLTGFISWGALWMLIVAGRGWISSENDRRRLYVIAALLWLLPYLGVRTSGETMSAAMLCVGIALLQWREDQSAFKGRFGFAVLAGFAFGLCFEFRYPSVVMAAGGALFYLRATDDRAKLFLGLALGGAIALALGALIDFWGYGVPSFPFLGYLHGNFVEGRAAAYGTWPFYAYFFYPIASPMAPLVLFVTIMTVIAWARRPGNVLVWATLPYVVALSMVGHKETRFLFPMAPLFPFLIVFAISEYSVGSRIGAVVRWFTTGHRLRFLAIWNVAGLLVLMWLPTMGEFPVYRLIEREAAITSGPLKLVTIHDERHLYKMFHLRMRFIEPKNLATVSNPALGELKENGKTFLVAVDRPTALLEQAAWVTGNCTVLNLPAQWYVFFDQHLRSKPKQRWELYRCGQVALGRI